MKELPPAVAQWAALVRTLRGSLLQKEYAERLRIARSLLSAAEGGNKVGPSVAEALIHNHPGRAGDIEYAYKQARSAWSASADEPTRDEISSARRLLAANRPNEARAVLQGLVREPLLAADHRPWVYEALAKVLIAAGEPELVSQILRSEGSLTSPKMVTSVARIAGMLNRLDLHGHAMDLVDQVIRPRPMYRELWRRRGIIQWYSLDLAGAYASLEVARRLGVQRCRVFHARGQVLVELGEPETALNELRGSLTDSRTQLSTAYVTSAMAAAYGALNQPDVAERLFSEAEATTPSNAWNFWRWGSLYYNTGNQPDAFNKFRLALQVQGPALPLNRRRHVEKILEGRCSG